MMALGLVSIVPSQTRRIVDARAPAAPDETMEIARVTPIHFGLRIVEAQKILKQLRDLGHRVHPYSKPCLWPIREYGTGAEHSPEDPQGCEKERVENITSPVWQCHVTEHVSSRLLCANPNSPLRCPCMSVA